MKVALLLLAVAAVANAQTGPILTSPEVTNWGDWGQWHRCQENTFATAFILSTHPYEGLEKDDTANNGIRLACNSRENPALPEHLISSTYEFQGVWGEKYSCPGYATGFQFRSESSQGAFVDDTAANNLRVFCDGEVETYLQGDGGAFGSWTQPRYCQPQQAFCAIRTQVEVNAGRLDETALNNFSVECCDIIHPAKTCEPVASWEQVVACKNINGKHDKECSHEIRSGVSYSHRPENLYAPMIYEKNGFTLQSAVQPLVKNVGENLGSEYTVGVNGVQSSGVKHIIVPAGQDTKIEQLVVSCGMYSMRTSQMKRIDTDLTKRVYETNFTF